MSSSGYDRKIEFRAGAEKTAAEVLDSIHVGGVNTSELAREGLREMLRRVVTDEDRVQIYDRYTEGEIEEEVARLLLGDEFDALERDRRDFERAMELDADGVVRDE